MNPETSQTTSIPGLLRELRDETTTLLRQEVKLAKAELKENASRVGNHVTQLAIGTFVAYAGIIVLLIGLGHLLAAWCIRLGLDEEVAQWLAPSIVGLIVALIGWAMLSRAKHAMSDDPLAPRQTIETLREHKEWVQSKLHHSS